MSATTLFGQILLGLGVVLFSMGVILVGSAIGESIARAVTEDSEREQKLAQAFDAIVFGVVLVAIAMLFL